MSLLSNQTDALDRAGKLDREELEKRLGVMEKTEGRILGAIYNGDTYGKMNMLLYSNPAGIVAGLTAAVKLSQAQGAVLVTDCEINEQEYMAAAGTAGLDLVIEKAAMVNKVAHKKDRMMTFEELAALAERLMGREPGIFAAVDEEVPVEAAPDTPVTELLGTEDYRGILTGHQFYSREQLKGLKIKDLKTWGGYIQTIRPSDCVVDLAAKDVLVLRRKCCGKCTFCREGLYQISQILEQVS